MHPTTFVDTPAGAEAARRALAGAEAVAVDCEAAGFHRYSDRLCLVQVSTPCETFVLDPLATPLDDCLRPCLEAPDTPVLMHGAVFDLMLLRRDLGVGTAGLVDTQVLASFAGEPAVGLQALLEQRLGVRVTKKFQRADWAARPLPHEMIDYAAGDTRHLHQLADVLGRAVREQGRERWAEEECRRIEKAAAEPAEEGAIDPVTRVKGAGKLDDRTVTALREALRWRDGIARSKDRAPFRVATDQALLAAVLAEPADVEALVRVRGFPSRLARERGRGLVQVLRRVRRMPAETLAPYPSGNRRKRADRTDEAVLERLKEVRNRAATELGLERGRVMANQALQAVAAAQPKSLAELASVKDLRRWQVEVLGTALLEALAG